MTNWAVVGVGTSLCRTLSASGEESSGIGKYAFVIDFFRAVEFRNRHAAMDYLEDLLCLAGS